MLHDFPVIDAKVPHNPARPPEARVVSASVAFQNEVASVFRGGRTNVLGRMNRNVARPHRPGDETAVNVGRQQRHSDTRQSRGASVRTRAAGEQETNECENGKGSSPADGHISERPAREEVWPFPLRNIHDHYSNCFRNESNSSRSCCSSAFISATSFSMVSSLDEFDGTWLTVVEKAISLATLSVRSGSPESS